jgi:hypothetical protein
MHSPTVSGILPVYSVNDPPGLYQLRASEEAGERLLLTGNRDVIGSRFLLLTV